VGGAVNEVVSRRVLHVGARRKCGQGRRAAARALGVQGEGRGRLWSVGSKAVAARQRLLAQLMQTVSTGVGATRRRASFGPPGNWWLATALLVWRVTRGEARRDAAVQRGSLATRARGRRRSGGRRAWRRQRPDSPGAGNASVKKGREVWLGRAESMERKGRKSGGPWAARQ
jgi:hypothetical protein